MISIKYDKIHRKQDGYNAEDELNDEINESKQHVPASTSRIPNISMPNAESTNIKSNENFAMPKDPISSTVLKTDNCEKIGMYAYLLQPNFVQKKIMRQVISIN